MSKERLFSIGKVVSSVHQPTFVCEEYIWSNGENVRLVVSKSHLTNRSAFALGRNIANLLDDEDVFIPSYGGMNHVDKFQFASGMNFQKKD